MNAVLLYAATQRALGNHYANGRDDWLTARDLEEATLCLGRLLEAMLHEET
jgi:hypothetical protein